MEHPCVPELIPAYETKLAAIARAQADFDQAARSIAQTYRLTVEQITTMEDFPPLQSASETWRKAVIDAQTAYNDAYEALFGAKAELAEAA